jgi:hypothetical protein
MKRWYRLLVMIAVTVACAAGMAHAESMRWHEMQSAHFIIYYSDGREATASTAAEIAERWRAILIRKLEFTPDTRIPIYLYPDRRSFADAAGVAPGDQIVGLAHTQTLKVRIDASGAFTDISRVIPHELVHVFVFSQLREAAERLPLWMHEGLAKYLGDDWTGADAELLADAASGSRLLPLSEISDEYPKDKERLSIAYAESYSAVKYMADKYRLGAIRDLLAELEKGHSFDSSMVYAIGVSPEQFETDWRQQLWSDYDLNRWLKFGMDLIYAFMAGVGILAYRARMAAKRRKLLEFEEEEAFQDVDDNDEY